MTISTPTEEKFGYQDTSFKSAGEFEGIQCLVKSFYHFMDRLTEASTIRSMHEENMSVIEDKLIYFLCYWLGGPRRYVDKYGPVNIPKVHMHLSIGNAERDAWLLCMEKAVDQQPYSPAFKKYLLEQLAIPAERIRQSSKGRLQNENKPI